MDLIEKTKKYFNAFSSKDLSKLSEIYSDEVCLIDWDGTSVGSKNVLNANEELFKHEFQLKVLDTIQHDDRTFNTLLIEIGGETLEVIDVIKFGKDAKIEYIRAYKG
jgi:hypothetical protein